MKIPGGFDFNGGRPPLSDIERWASGYHEAQANARTSQLPLWRVLRVSDAEQARIVPDYFKGYQAGERDAREGVNDCEDAWWRYQIKRWLCHHDN